MLAAIAIPKPEATSLLNRLVLSLIVWCCLSGSAWSKGCFPLALNKGDLVYTSTSNLDEPGGFTLSIRYLGHSSFELTSGKGIRAITDYYGIHRDEYLPDIVTMNNAHSTHFTPFPDPAIKHVLKGWGENNSLAVHDVEMEDLRVRNVPTSVRGRSGAETNSNSIFVFEFADLCAAHLGHLHHVLTDVHLGELGVIDVLMVPMDGMFTLSHAETATVVEQISPSVIIPMHYWGETQITQFASYLKDSYAIKFHKDAELRLSRQTLPVGSIMVMGVSAILED